MGFRGFTGSNPVRPTMKGNMETIPDCPYCDVPMERFDKNRDSFVCPSCFIPLPRDRMTARKRRILLDENAAV